MEWDVKENPQAIESEVVRLLRDRLGRGGELSFVGLRRSSGGRSGDSPLQILMVRLADGTVERVFLKDFWRPGTSQAEVAARHARECAVYEQLLAGTDLGTARYYGAIADPMRSRFVVALEFIPGELLHWRDTAHFLATADWLGRLQVHFLRHPPDLGADTPLPRHDQAFFDACASRIAATELPAPIAQRLQALLQHYEAETAELAQQPPCLVHGTFKRRHIMVCPAGEEIRVCPMDWEMAALGSPLYDLAMLSESCTIPIREAMWERFRDVLVSHDVARPGGRHLRRLLNAFRLHQLLTSLDPFPGGRRAERRALRIVAKSERLTRMLREGALAE